MDPAKKFDTNKENGLVKDFFRRKRCSEAKEFFTSPRDLQQEIIQLQVCLVFAINFSKTDPAQLSFCHAVSHMRM